MYGEINSGRRAGEKEGQKDLSSVRSFSGLKVMKVIFFDDSLNVDTKIAICNIYEHEPKQLSI